MEAAQNRMSYIMISILPLQRSRTTGFRSRKC